MRKTTTKKKLFKRVISGIVCVLLAATILPGLPGQNSNAEPDNAATLWVDARRAADGNDRKESFSLEVGTKVIDAIKSALGEDALVIGTNSFGEEVIISVDGVEAYYGGEEDMAEQEAKEADFISELETRAAELDVPAQPEAPTAPEESADPEESIDPEDPTDHEADPEESIDSEDPTDSEDSTDPELDPEEPSELSGLSVGALDKYAGLSAEETLYAFIAEYDGILTDEEKAAILAKFYTLETYSCWMIVINNEIGISGFELSSMADAVVGKDDVIALVYSKNYGSDVFEGEAYEKIATPLYNTAWTTDTNSEVERQSWKFSDALFKLAKDTNATITSSDPGDSSKNDLLWFKKGYTFYNGASYDLYIKFDTSAKITSWGNHKIAEGEYDSFEEGSSEKEKVKIKALQVCPNFTEYQCEIWLTTPREDTDPDKDKPKLNKSDIVKNIPLVVGPCWLAHDSKRQEYIRIYSDEAKVYTNIYDSTNTLQKRYLSETGKTGWTALAGDETNNYDSIFYYMLGLGYTDDHTVKVGWMGKEASIPFEMRVGFDAYVVRFTDDENHTLVSDGGNDIVEDIPVGNKPLYPTTGIQSSDIKFWTLDQDISFNKGGQTITYTTNDRLTEEQVKELLENITDNNITKYYNEYTKNDKTNKDALIASYKQLELTAHKYYELEYKNQDNDTSKYPEPPQKEDEMIKGDSLANKGGFEIGQTYKGKDGKWYKFEGWYKEPGVSTEIKLDASSTEKMPGSNLTVYAKWSEVTDIITVDFDLNAIDADPAKKPSDQNFDKATGGNPVNPTPTGDSSKIPTRPGYTFGGWSDVKGGTTPVDVTQKVTEDKTYYAIWEKAAPDKINVYFDLNDTTGTATNKPSTQTIDKGTKPASADKIPTRPGYTFVGWGESPTSTTPVNVTANPLNKDKTFYAIWRPVSTAGGSSGGSSGGSTGGSSGGSLTVPPVTVPGPVLSTTKPTNSAPSTPSETPAPAPAPETPAGTPVVDTTPTVEGTPAPAPTPEAPVPAPAPAVTVTFQSELGNIPAPQTMTPGQVAYNPGAPLDPASLKPGMVINGQRFEGWYTDPQFKNAYKFGTPVTEDMVLYAKWTKVGEADKSPKTADNNWMLMLLGGAMAILAFAGIKVVRIKKRDRFS